MRIRQAEIAMIERTDALRSSPILYPRVAALPAGLVGIVYLAAYLLLDWISFIEPYTYFGITPWLSLIHI